MKINWAQSQVVTALKTINYGGCFIYDNVLYIKTDTEKQLGNDLMRIMVVDLENGVVDYLFSNTSVMPVEAEINFIKRKR